MRPSFTGKAARVNVHGCTCDQPSRRLDCTFITPNSHSPQDTTRQSSLCRVRRGCGVNQLLGLNCPLIASAQNGVTGSAQLFSAMLLLTRAREQCTYRPIPTQFSITSSQVVSFILHSFFELVAARRGACSQPTKDGFGEFAEVRDPSTQLPSMAVFSAEVI